MENADEKDIAEQDGRGAKGEKDDGEMDLQMQDISTDEKGMPSRRASVGWGDSSSNGQGQVTQDDPEPAETKRSRRRKEEKSGEAA